MRSITPHFQPYHSLPFASTTIISLIALPAPHAARTHATTQIIARPEIHAMSASTFSVLFSPVRHHYNYLAYRTPCIPRGTHTRYNADYRKTGNPRNVRTHWRQKCRNMMSAGKTRTAHSVSDACIYAPDVARHPLDSHKIKTHKQSYGVPPSEECLLGYCGHMRAR